MKLKHGQGTFRNSIDDGVVLDVAFIAIHISEKVKNQIQATLYITSERNSFGAVLNGWYDGKVNPILLPRGGLSSIQLTGMKRFEYLEKTCKNSSFYECLGEKLMTHKDCQSNGVPCTLYSFPNDKPPLCPQKIMKNEACKNRSNILSAMNKCLSQIPCTTEEYEFSQYKDWSAEDTSNAQRILQTFLNDSNLVDRLMVKYENKFVFILEFARPRWSNGPYAIKVQKQIHKEYLAWTVTSMIGNIGGQLGLWLGFSFTGFLAGTFNVFPRLRNFVYGMLKKSE